VVYRAGGTGRVREPARRVPHLRRRAYYRDPDGNQVELLVDNFPTVEKLDAFFRGGAFAKNPIGVNFDPEWLLARFRRGDPTAELVKQGSA